MKKNRNLIIIIAISIIILVGMWWYLSVATEETDAGDKDQVATTSSVKADHLGETMSPSKNIIENIKSTEGLQMASMALRATDLSKKLSKEKDGPYTIFVPQDNAFQNIPESVKAALQEDADMDMIKNILEYHVVVGALREVDMKDGETLVTLSGEKLHIKKDKNEDIIINGVARVVSPDGVSSNGVVQVIDTVLLPEGMRADDESANESLKEEGGATSTTLNQ